MRIIRAEGALQRDLTPAGPTVEALIDQTPDGGRLAATEIVIPPGVGMREHDHGGSEALLVPLDGVLAVTSGTQRRDISSGMVVLLERGERVQLSNLTSEPFTVIVVSTSVPEPPTADCGTDLPGESVQWVAIPSATLDQLDDDEAMHLDLGGHPICLARSGGAFYAVLDEQSRPRGVVRGRYRERSRRVLAARLSLRPRHRHPRLPSGHRAGARLSGAGRHRRRRSGPAAIGSHVNFPGATTAAHEQRAPTPASTSTFAGYPQP